MGFQDLSWNISIFSLVILAASVVEISCGKADTETNEGKNPTPRLMLTLYLHWKLYFWNTERCMKNTIQLTY